jgi:hypothetical protein
MDSSINLFEFHRYNLINWIRYTQVKSQTKGLYTTKYLITKQEL